MERPLEGGRASTRELTPIPPNVASRPRNGPYAAARVRASARCSVPSGTWRVFAVARCDCPAARSRRASSTSTRLFARPMGRPLFVPWRRARAIPAFVLSTRRASSCSPTQENIPTSKFRVGPVVSNHPSRTLTICTPASSSALTSDILPIIDRPKRSNAHTTSTSNFGSSGFRVASDRRPWTAGSWFGGGGIRG